MKRSNLIILILGLALFAACSKKPEGTLETKKATLDSLKKAQATTAGLIKALEDEIALLDTGAQSEVKIKNVSTEIVQKSTFQHFVDVTGVVEAEENINVSVKMPAMITKIYVKEGQNVSKGQLLAAQDGDVIRKSIEELKNGLELANTLYDKQKALWEQKIGSEVQYLQAKNQKESLEKRIRTTEAQLSQTMIYAPVSGVIENVFLKEGELASPGVPLFQLVNLGDLKVTTQVPDAYLSSIKNGDAVIVELPDLKLDFKGTILRTGSVVNPGTRTVKVEIKVPNSKNQLRPNMLAVVKINDQNNEGVVLQENLIQQSEFGQVVFVAGNENGKQVAKMRKVETGLAYAGKVLVTKGLELGEKLITVGYQELVDGQLINQTK